MAEKFSIRKVLEHYTDEILPERGGWNQICCPVHDERRPSASFNESAGKIHCFGCNFHGDALDLIGKKEGIDDYLEQVKIAEAITGETAGAAPSLGAPSRRLPRRITDGASGAAPGAARPVARPAGARVKRRRRI